MPKFEKNGIMFDAEGIPAHVLKKYAKTDLHTILEFGSYDGGSAMQYKEQFPNARVISFEACPERFSIIDKYQKLVGLECYHYAICDEDGEVDFYQMQDSNDVYGASGSICKHTDKYKNTWKHLQIIDEPIKVKSIRIDTFCKLNNIENIDLVHIDVEGAEHLVIKGFGEMRPTFVWAETHLDKRYYGDKAYDIGEIDKLLTSMGYSFIHTNRVDRLYMYNK